MDAYSQLLPTTKRLIRKLSTSEHQIILQQQVQHSVFSEMDLSSINSSSSEKSVLRLSANKVKVPSISDDSPFNVLKTANRIGSAQIILRMNPH